MNRKLIQSLMESEIADERIRESVPDYVRYREAGRRLRRSGVNAVTRAGALLGERSADAEALVETARSEIGKWEDLASLGGLFVEKMGDHADAIKRDGESLHMVAAELEEGAPDDPDHLWAVFVQHAEIIEKNVGWLRAVAKLAARVAEMERFFEALNVDDEDRETRAYHRLVGRALHSEREVRRLMAGVVANEGWHPERPLYESVPRLEEGYRRAAEFFAQVDRQERLAATRRTPEPVVEATHCAEPGCTRGRVFFDEDGTGYCKRHGNERGLRPHGKVT